MKALVSDKGFKQAASRVALYYHLTASELPALQEGVRSGIDVACVNAEAKFLERVKSSVFCFGLSELPGYWTIVETEKFLALIEVVFEIMAARSEPLSWLRRLYKSSGID